MRPGQLIVVTVSYSRGPVTNFLGLSFPASLHTYQWLCNPLVAFQKSWHGWNRRTMWSRVLSGVHFLKDLDYLLPLCNEDTSPVMPALIISGCNTLWECVSVGASWSLGP
ncbi:hypothetical protein HanPSC8_Chr15g0669761 [Helianthus annuus]|nr:hypothetical protein HanPSC8_Chr15g0669761 [Helianthus annuus]